MNHDHEMRLPALAIRQAGGRTLYSFGVDGKKLPLFAAVSRIKRDERHAIAGYQRAESIAHIKSIRKYLESADAILPNALVVAFDDRVRFEGSSSKDGQSVCVGELVIPVKLGATELEKPGWIVDGQQRTAAIREADLDEFPVYVTAFITKSVAEQRSQFILVNSTKPLPKGLIYELLPATPEEHLPALLRKKRYPALLVDHLNHDPDSPLRQRIRTPTSPRGTIKDNSLLRVLAMSIEDGALYDWFDSETGGGDTEAMLTLLKRYWSAVATTFPKAWDQPPRRSRLVHGVGIVAVASLMDEIFWQLKDEGVEDIPTAPQFEEHLAKIADDCRWTEGNWPLSANDNRPWNELQNTPRDIRALTDFLVGLYQGRVRGTDTLAA